MDELDALRGMRTALAEEEPPDALAARIQWRTGTGSAAPESAPRPLRRRLRLPLAGGLAAALAAGAAAIVVTQPGSDAPDRPRPPAEGNVLLVAATNAEKAPLGAYWHTRSISGDIYAVGGSAKNFYKVDARQGNESWTGRDGRGVSVYLDPPDVPLTAQDAQKWRAAGSRRMVRVPDPEGGAGSVSLDMAGTGTAVPSPTSPGDLAYGLTPARLDRLPTEPKALENALLGLKGNWRAYAATAKKEPIRALRGRERVRALSDVTIALLSKAPAPPKVRAAAFRMLAAQPGVRAGGRTTDPLGRTGTVISLPLKTTVPLGLYTAPKQLGTYTRELIVDPARGMLLAVRDLVATPPKGSRPLPPGDDGKPRSLTAKNMPDRFSRRGDLASYEAFEVAQWTDQAPPH
ncbi:CU044_5270 family protein [Actinomadura verrucosospora]|uniref:Uncharacterized protein n=1 Tax=Actinomadura verrucosospora TaxID=46165 RepID=A0A7D4ARI4_ACTVE|nr:CU044_5270 family protein [Actinomadura verrucosospora]QKG24828.1 hypothetical protein ACTIVE_6477 [Actinomadura verrucosospora]